MANSKHTPGPWAYEDPMGPEILSIVANPNGEVYEWIMVAQIGTSKEDGDRRSLKEHEANARLLAAAPELLAALIELMNAQPSIMAEHPCYDLAEAAVAKALGHSSHNGRY